MEISRDEYAQTFEKPAEIKEAEKIFERRRSQERRRSLEYPEWETMRKIMHDVIEKNRQKQIEEHYKEEKTLKQKRIEEDAKVRYLEEDKNTPDHWIKRHPALIRLTGVHPLNAEPPTQLLLEHGFITPASIHYVRNHGAVPKLDWKTHRLTVDGLVKNPKDFSMDEIIQFPSIEIPVTVTCDGNRRKEINLIKHSRGFDWGSGAIGTAMWKGVRLSDILDACGVDKEDMEDKFVCFEGSDQLAKGTYGTSVPLPIAVDPTHDVILAYEMNGKRLTPDHGYPIRLILPGMVGGRMVKWLKKITVSKEESQSFYHWHDNKVLPSAVDFSAVESGWWYKPEFTLYDMNINSIIITPAHQERLEVGPVINENQKYTIKGVAFSGGGRRVTRVEVTLDEGKTWIPCNVVYPDKITRHGLRVWVWCRWDVSIEVWKIFQSKSICVRAWDRSCNTQPKEPTWNLLGMMNNAWYKIMINLNEIKEKEKFAELVFLHPTVPDQISTGWKEKIRKPVSSATSMEYRSFTWSEVKQHNSPNDCWIVIDGDVYDVSSYMKDHPGGETPLLLYSGKDASKEYRQIHGQDAHEIKNWFRIGSIIQLPETRKRKENCALNPKKWIDVKMIKKEIVTHDTFHFIFELPDKNLPTGIDVGQHILLGADIGENFVVRPYTPVKPVNDQEENGTFELVIKIYGKGKNAKKEGLFTSFLDTLKEGDSIKAKGPAGHILYRGRGIITVDASTIQITHISMIAGGTGITPMFQLLKAILTDPDDNTKIALLYSNHTEDDILLRKDLDELAEKHKDQFKVWYTVSNPPENWKYSVGRINDNMIRKYLYPSSSESIALICGPPAMIEHGCFPSLHKAGYVDENIFEF
jgi:nitrate reductase (NAD(P)H)